MATPTHDRNRPEARAEDVAEVVLAEWVKGCAAKTSKWLDESSRAFERHLHKALHPPGYTSAELTKDVTEVWTRNLAYVVSLFTVTRPVARAREVTVDDTAETGRG
jgi:hypothetical protein